MTQDALAPALFDGLGRVPIPKLVVHRAIQQNHVVPPRDVRNRLRGEGIIREIARQGSQVVKRAARETAHPRESRLEVVGGPRDDVQAPAEAVLSLHDEAARVSRAA